MDSELDGRGRGRTRDGPMTRAIVIERGGHWFCRSQKWGRATACGLESPFCHRSQGDLLSHPFFSSYSYVASPSPPAPARPPGMHFRTRASSPSAVPAPSQRDGRKGGRTLALAHSLVGTDLLVFRPRSSIRPLRLQAFTLPSFLPSLLRRTAPIGEQTDGRREGGREAA